MADEALVHFFVYSLPSADGKCHNKHRALAMIRKRQEMCLMMMNRAAESEKLQCND